ncbi:LysR family transcriptional regulator [Herbidospora cretacea]|uniref:LysR family transcriptional regulator n=1 Tax=Herbidospora cretacea TaxID=28444 RepID=UPI000774CF33|nr:LysR family transcriptional regulator [Herbidospora cretacea]
MELRQLRYLVTIAETGNLGRAAERLFVSQPALSQTVRALESELGVRLFDRHPGGVSPNTVGRDVVEAARRALAAADGVRAAAARVLRVGFEASGAGDLTSRVRAEFARRHPEARVEPKRYDWGGETAALHEGLVDVAFVWLPADLTGFEVEVVHREARVVGLPEGHRLAGRAGLTLMDVRDEPLMWTERAPRAWVDWWAVNPRPDGSEPKWGPTNDNVEEMLDQVADGVAVCFGPASMARYYTRPGLVWVPLTDAEPLRVALAWPAGSPNPLVAAFVAVVRELSRR